MSRRCPVRYSKLGRTGLKVSAICLGTMLFGDQVNEETARAIVDTCWEAGVNFFDTADVYVQGRSEEVLGRLLKGRRREAIIATKVQGTMGQGPNDRGLSRAHIMQAVEASLRRLQTDYIDLYQTHWPDYDTPLEETLRALDDLVHQGKVRYIGCSNYPAWYLCKSLWISDVRNLVRFDCAQPRYNLLDRAIEGELLPLCAEEGIGVIPYNPLAGGFLTGKYKRGQPPPEDTRFARRKDLYVPRYWHDPNFDAVEKLVDAARRYGKTPPQLALAWLLHNPVITAPIVGASRPSQIEETLQAVDMTLSEEELAACDAIQVDAH